MDNLCAVIKNLFCYINPWVIIRSNDFYSRIKEDEFLELGAGYIKRYSNDELKNMYQFMKNEFAWHNRRLVGTDQNVDDKIHLNVFDTLSMFNFTVLTEENLEPKCKYPHLLWWRDMIIQLEEDLFVTSYLAQNDQLRGKIRKCFFWKSVIGHNNYALNQMMRQGVADNHFHLKGSAPMFHLSWINLMNDPLNYKFERLLDEFNSNRLQKNIENGINEGIMSYALMWRKASIIRLYLYADLVDDYLDIPNAYITLKSILGIMNQQEREMVLGAEKNLDDSISVKVFENRFSAQLSLLSYKKIKKYISKKWIIRVLKDREMRENDIYIIKLNINRLKENHKGKNEDYLLDYTLCKHFITKNVNNSLSEVICGERWFMYSRFLRVYEHDSQENFNNNLFYMYLVMKAHIRAEIIQANMNIGFDNFYKYQERKENFIDGTILEPIYLKMAVRDTLFCQPVLSLEARIAPKNDVIQLKKAIEKYDKLICADLTEKQEFELKQKYFYVIHFIKEPDKEEIDDFFSQCRHYKKRREVRDQALAIARLREQESSEANRILGIDASSSEISCRPEVFSHAFRYLKKHTPTSYYHKADVSFPKLMATFHVGEDFLDAVDGLRAIDEAIVFLNLTCGDRLGHALALGIDLEEWYMTKANRILISKQAYLDNLSWLLGKMRRYGIDDASEVQNYILKKINDLLQEIYLDHVSTQEFEAITKSCQEYRAKKNIRVTNGFMGVSLDYNNYYDSMKLRGDDPELYSEGFFKNPLANLDEWDYYAINREYPDSYQIRYNSSVAYFYYLYHFNKNVRQAGDEMIEIKINPNVVHVIQEVQYRMQLDISDMGISIETNPSSNFQVGTFRRYDKHPIVKWYNNGLVHDEELLRRCPQIQVSINTDDQGVFATYIENEYAYMALALEKCKDKEGNRIYNRTMILQWLDSIRRMSLIQSFNHMSNLGGTMPYGY